MKIFSNIGKVLIGIFTCLFIDCSLDYETSADYLPLDDSTCPYNGIPRLIIETQNFSDIRNKENDKSGIMQIYGESAPETDPMDITIHGRGNTTWDYPKAAYTITLKKKHPLINMPSGKKWILLANYRDRTKIRNAVALELAHRSKLSWTPNGKFVELYLNRKYMGLFYLCEKINFEKNRLNLGDESFLLEFDTHYDEMVKFKTSYSQAPVNIKKPDSPSPSSITYIKNFIDSLELSLKENNSDTSYTHYINSLSFIHYFMIYELTTNREPYHPRSLFMHKEPGGKLTAGPVWDFDYGTFNANRKGWLIKDAVIYKDLTKKNKFKNELRLEWNDYKKNLSNIDEFIDSLAQQIQPAVKKDIDRWPIHLNSGLIGDEDEDFDTSIRMLKKALHNRVAELDSLIVRL